MKITTLALTSLLLATVAHQARADQTFEEAKCYALNGPYYQQYKWWLSAMRDELGVSRESAHGKLNAALDGDTNLRNPMVAIVAGLHVLDEVPPVKDAYLRCVRVGIDAVLGSPPPPPSNPDRPSFKDDNGGCHRC